ncbi:MAG TPA: N-acetylmuramoyl-L-alanine amidase [Blastocatellia bacterium]|nr:N-acetylmuramoyl-L-alanine amidase [Blastocatellia bacterium]
MLKRGYSNLALRAIVLTLVFCLTAGPILNAADPESSAHSPRTLAQNLFQYAGDLSRALHERPSDERTLSEYRKALDAYGQITRLNTDTYFSAESLMRMAELQREMADAANDSALYQQSIATFRRVIVEHPQSTFVGDALTSIAQVYEENLQDLDGAAAAYRELIAHFPSSVMAREGRAVLARFDIQLRNRPVDVLVSADHARNARSLDEERPRLTNVRNFSGPDYARVVIDLSGEAEYSGGREGDNRLNIRLPGAALSDALLGRRFIVGDSSLLKRITVRETDKTSEIQIEVGSRADYSMFRLSEPERIIIDIHAAAAGARSAGRIEIDRRDPSHATEDVTVVKPTGSAKDEDAARTNKSTPARPIFGLPELTDPILPHNHAGGNDSTATSNSGASITVESRAGDTPIKCVVIDPGHGGHDTGTISGNGLREKDLVLDVAQRLKAYIKGKYPGVEVVMTRDSDRFVALEERTAIANSRHADLFISVHANASPSRIASGVETFFVTPDRAKSQDPAKPPQEPGKTVAELTKPAVQEADAALSEPITASVRVGNRVTESRELARYIQAGLVRGIGAASPRTAANRGVKHAAFAVLVGAAMPSVLAEVSFISNPRDEALLQTSQFRERIAAGLFAGLNGYLKRRI